MTLNDILRTAQGGKAVGHLARRFELTPDAAEAAAQAMIPAFSVALDRLRAHPEALGGLIAEMVGGGHGASYADPSADPGPAGAEAVVKVFGSPEAIRSVVAHVAAASGVAPETVEAMLPAVASLLIGGLARAMASEGPSGALDELARAAAAPGGLGAALGPAAGSGGGLMGFFGSLFGGGHEPANPQTAMLVAGLATLGGMFVAGVQASAAHQASLNAVAQSFTRPPPTI